MKLLATLMLSFLMIAHTQAKDIYVSEIGSDKNPGSFSLPFASVYRAQLEARKFKTTQVNIWLRGGVYYLNRPILFTVEDNRGVENPLNLNAYQREKVEIKGSVRLELSWKQGNGVFQAKVPANVLFDQLYVNGKLMQMARYPNYKEGKKIFNGTAADVLSADRVKKWKNPEGAYLHVMQAHMWGGFAYQVKGKNQNGTELLMDGGWQNNRPSAMHKDYRFIENVKEELDTLQEWYYDKHEQQLYIKSDEGLSDALIESPQLESLIEITAPAGTPVKNINIKGVSFSHCLRTFMKNKEPLLRSDWTIYRKGAITMDGAARIQIQRCVFSEIGGNVIVYSNYNKQHLFSGNHIYNCGGNAVLFVGDPKAVRSPVFQYGDFVPFARMDMQAGPLGDNFPAECTVADNLIHNIGQVEKQTAGIQISMARNIKLSHNTIYEVPRAGININEGTWGGHRIEYNDVFDTVLETGDHGAFNSWGRDRFWHPNRATMDTLVANHPQLIFLDAPEPTVLFNNRFRCDHGWDIDLDDGSSNYIIQNNVCLNGGIKLREGFKRRVENNIIINNSFHPHVWFKNSNDVFKHNILGAGYFPIRIPDWGKQVDSNFFSDEASLKRARELGTDKKSMAGSPRFIHAEKGDYRLRKSSKAFITGFKNFEMNFGVTSPGLIKKSRKVTIPILMALETKAESVYDFAGVKVKNLTTLAERSATGMPAETGVLILDVDPNSLMTGVLKPNDVILKMGEIPIATIADLVRARQGSQSKKTIILKLFRDQKEQEVMVKLK